MWKSQQISVGIWLCKDSNYIEELKQCMLQRDSKSRYIKRCLNSKVDEVVVQVVVVDVVEVV